MIASIEEPAVIARILDHLGRDGEPPDPANPSRTPPQWDALQGRLVYSQNIAQTFTMAATGNAELALVAHAQALAYGGEAAFVLVPAQLHAPIRQDAVLLSRATRNSAAAQFLAFLRSPAAKSIIERSGYLP